MMAEGKGKLEWQQTSLLAFLIYKANFKGDKSPDDFNPYAKQRKKGVNFEELRRVFKGNKDARPQGS